MTCTAFFVCLAVWHPAYRALTISSQSLWIVSFILSMVCIYALGCYKQIARKVPLNYFLLAVFTIAESYTVSCITNLYTPETVAIAAVLTASVTVALTAYAIHRGAQDLTMMGGLLVILFFVVITAFILQLFLRSRILEILICSCLGTFFLLI